jgi:hypothetical protein
MKDGYRPLPLSVMSFSTLVEKRFVYADKTGMLHELVTSKG